MRVGVPEELVEHPDPQQVKLAGEFLVGRHEVAVEMHVDVLPLLNLKHLHVFDILQVGVDRHVQIVEVGSLHLQTLLVKLGVFLALLNDVG